MAKSSNGNSRDYYSFGEGTREYLYNVARIYDILREGCTFSNGKGEARVEFAIEGEGKKLFALYLAAGIGGKYFFGSPKIYSSDAYNILFPAFFKSDLYKSKSKNISQDDASRIISQEFSDLLSDLDKNSSYFIQMLVKQTLKVAKAKETNPIYQMCKIYDGSGKNKLTDSYVSSLYYLYKDISKKSVILPLTREAFEKKVSIEAKKKSSKKTITETAGEKVQAVENGSEKSSIFGMLFGNGTSTKRIRQETKPFQQDRKNGVVERGKLNKEAGTESKQVDEEQKSSVDVELSEIDRWQKANQVVNAFLKEIIPESEWRRINQDGLKKALKLNMMDFLYGHSSNMLLSAEYVEEIANIEKKLHEEALRRVKAKIAGEKFVPDDTSSRIDNGYDPEADKTLFAIIDTVTDGNSKVSQELLNLIKEYGGNYYPQYPGICILADCVRLYKENGCDLNEVLSGRGNKLAEDNIFYILKTIKKIEEMPRKSLAQVTSMDEPLKWHHENNPVPKNYYGSISKTRKSRTYASDTIKSTTTSSSSSSSLGTSDSSELGRMLGGSTGDSPKSDDKGRHL